MKSFNRLLIQIISCILIISCNENETMLFDTSIDAGIYFQTSAGYTQNNQGVIVNRYYRDSMTFSMSSYTLDIKKIVVNINSVKLMGAVVDYDRKVSFKLNKELTTAIEGEDFTVNYDTIYIRAGKASTVIPVTLYRTPKLTEHSEVIVFDLLENENFSFHMNTYKADEMVGNAGPDRNALRYKIIFSDMVERPWLWGWYGEPVFGEWTVEKFNLINSFMGWTSYGWQYYWNKAGNPSYGTLVYAAIKMHTYLQEAADSGNPIKEQDGSYMQLAGEYIVDYSAYEQ